MSIILDPGIPCFKLDLAILSNNGIISNKINKKEVRNFLKNRFLNLVVINCNTSISIKFSTVGFKKVTNTLGTVKQHCLANLDQILKLAVPRTNIENDKKGRPDFISITNLKILIDYDFKYYPVWIVLRETRDGHLFYDLSIIA